MSPELELLYVTLSLREFALATAPAFIQAAVENFDAQLDDAYLTRHASRLRTLACVQDSPRLRVAQRAAWLRHADGVGVYAAFERALYVDL